MESFNVRLIAWKNFLVATFLVIVTFQIWNSILRVVKINPLYISLIVWTGLTCYVLFSDTLTWDVKKDLNKNK